MPERPGTTPDAIRDGECAACTFGRWGARLERLAIPQRNVAFRDETV